MLDALATIGRRTGRVTTALLAMVLLSYGALIGVPTLLGYQTYVITTGSMAGTADPGSLVIAGEVPVGDLAVGDVITYVPPPESGLDHPITHRLVDIDERDGSRVMRTQGDANAAADPWTFTLDADVQARMRTVVPHAGVPVMAMADRQVRLLAIGVPAAIIALLSAAEIVQVLRRPSIDGDETERPPADAETGPAPDAVGETELSVHTTSSLSSAPSA